MIGKGSFGKVALATHKLTNKKVAIKRLEKKNMQEDQVQRVMEEIKLMSAMKHRHVIRILEVFQTNQFIFLVLENAEGGDLLRYLF